MVEKYLIKEGINLYFIPNFKFKTFLSSVYIHRPLDESEASLNALLPQVLRRGNKTYKDLTQIQKKCEDLYGAHLFMYSQKKAETHSIVSGIETVSDNFALYKEGILEDSLKFLFDVLLNVVDEFDEDILKQEKDNLIERIKGLINDKRNYAYNRLIQEMCKNERYGVCELGTVERVSQITAKGLMAHYKKIITESPIDIFVSGNLSKEKAIELVKKYTGALPERRAQYPGVVIGDLPKEVRYVEEKLDVTQGKLSMGYRVKGADEYAMILFNTIFGGSTTSKLFLNVREKLSLAYYASSGYDRYKGIMTVNSGIEFSNYQKALDEINLQFSYMKNKNITQEEFDQAMLSIINSYKSLYDGLRSLESFYAAQCGRDMVDLETFIDKLSKVTLEDVFCASENVELDTVYFLKGI
ncbi:MAG: insulinase family protein [Clostridiaceae bacterium]|nr:insulinase family protein [Clostridiaceae bacterium]